MVCHTVKDLLLAACDSFQTLRVEGILDWQFVQFHIG